MSNIPEIMVKNASRLEEINNKGTMYVLENDVEYRLRIFFEKMYKETEGTPLQNEILMDVEASFRSGALEDYAHFVQACKEIRIEKGVELNPFFFQNGE